MALPAFTQPRKDNKRNLVRVIPAFPERNGKVAASSESSAKLLHLSLSQTDETSLIKLVAHAFRPCDRERVDTSLI
ncbi:hypothetical protein M8J75_001882 [Diaphorina citri]|nr:hypothetical protein M8J75_001882 [Diaphorina citri]